MNITYYHDRQLAFSPAFTFIFEGFVAMLREELAHPCLDFGNVSEVAYAVADDEVICAQVFSMDKMGRVFTQLAYTKPAYRGQGLAVAVYNHLETVIKKRPELTAVYTTCVEGNEPIQQVFKKTGREQFTSKFVKFFKGKQL